MKNFIKGFRRNLDGSWECVAPVTLDGPKGRIQVTEGSRFTRGTVFMGIDLAKWLDEEAEKQGLFKPPQ